MRLKRFCCVLALAGLAGMASAAAQQPPPDPYRSPYPPPPPLPLPVPFPDPAARDMMIRGAEQIMRALELMILSIPTYDPPVVTPDGDIIIKRRRGGAAKPPPEIERTQKPVPGATDL